MCTQTVIVQVHFVLSLCMVFKCNLLSFSVIKLTGNNIITNVFESQALKKNDEGACGSSVPSDISTFLTTTFLHDGQILISKLS